LRYTSLVSESAAYVEARESLRLAELDLIEHQERVAALRRALPPGPVVDDSLLVEGPDDLGHGDEPHDVRLSELFSSPSRPLIVYHLMYGKGQVEPCPMCTMWIDGFNGVAHHLRARVDIAVVAAADIGALREQARHRGWHNLRVLSAGTSSFKRDLGSEDEAGNQEPKISVFTKEAYGAVRHFYTGAPRLSDERAERGMDPVCATWQLLDLTPRGRGEWYASLQYD
jgi:predicted dithiol-disulfide oxidoreductase (DUF899 family)